MEVFAEASVRCPRGEREGGRGGGLALVFSSGAGATSLLRLVSSVRVQLVSEIPMGTFAEASVRSPERERDGRGLALVFSSGAGATSLLST